MSNKNWFLAGFSFALGVSFIRNPCGCTILLAIGIFVLIAVIGAMLQSPEVAAIVLVPLVFALALRYGIQWAKRQDERRQDDWRDG